MLTLDELGPALATAAERGAPAEAMPPATATLRRRVRRRRTTLVSAATALAVAAAAVVVMATRPPRTQEVRTTGPGDVAGAGDAGSVANLATGKWSQLPAPPLQARVNTVMVWTGDRLIVWGGAGLNGAVFNDGAVYDPAAKAWKAMAASPLGGSNYPKGLWSGKDVLVQTPTQDGAYDPRTDRWRLFPARPAAVSPVRAAVWTGRELVAVGGDALAAAALDPTTGQWRALAPVPAPAGHVASGVNPVWVGDRLLVWVAWKPPAPANQFAPLGPSGVDLFSFDLARNAWSDLHPSGSDPPAGPAHWNGEDVVFEGVTPTGVPGDGAPLSPTPQPVWHTVYRPSTNSYQRAPATSAAVAAFWTGRALGRFTGVSTGTPGIEAVDPVTGARTALAPPPATGCCPQHQFVWAGDQLFGYDEYAGLVRFGP